MIRAPLEPAGRAGRVREGQRRGLEGSPPAGVGAEWGRGARTRALGELGGVLGLHPSPQSQLRPRGAATQRGEELHRVGGSYLGAPWAV